MTFSLKGIVKNCGKDFLAEQYVKNHATLRNHLQFGRCNISNFLPTMSYHLICLISLKIKNPIKFLNSQQVSILKSSSNQKINFSRLLLFEAFYALSILFYETTFQTTFCIQAIYFKLWLSKQKLMVFIANKNFLRPLENFQGFSKFLKYK